MAVIGQGAIIASSLVEAWILPADTTDHTADEHIVDPPAIVAGNIVAGTGFTIYATARDGIPVPDALQRNLYVGDQSQPQTSVQEHGRTTPMPYGKWKVAWVWN